MNIQDYHNNLAEQLAILETQRRKRNVNKKKKRANISCLLNRQQNEFLKQVALLTELRDIMLNLKNVYNNNAYVLRHVEVALRVVNKEMDETFINAQNI